MTDYIGRHHRRVGRNGRDTGEALTNNTINFINSTFHSSPTYRVMEVESNKYTDVKEMEARVVEVERLGSLREIILRPTYSLEIGMYTRFDGDTWMLIDKYGGTGSTSVKMLAIRTNQFLRWNDENGDFREFNCVASATDLGSKSKQSKNEIEWNKYDVRLPVGQLFVSVELNEYTRDIGLNHRFIFGRNAYEITGIDDMTMSDDEGYGIIQFTAKITTKRAQDDFESGIADNKYGDIYYSEEENTSNGITSDKDENDMNGGRLW